MLGHWKRIQGSWYSKERVQVLSVPFGSWQISSSEVLEKIKKNVIFSLKVYKQNLQVDVHVASSLNFSHWLDLRKDEDVGAV